jgi:transcriptional regulator with XRE-family HTH domain
MRAANESDGIRLPFNTRWKLLRSYSQRRAISACDILAAFSQACSRRFVAMLGVVTDTTPPIKTPRCIFSNAAPGRVARQGCMAKQPIHRPTFIRQWRQHRGYSLDQLAERVPMDKGNLSKVERGLLPYNQELLERMAEALGTDPASLIMRDPSDSAAVWSIWDHASPGDKARIERVVTALFEDRKRA